MSDGAQYFISDAHLGAAGAREESERTARLHSFLASLPGRASELFIVGDLFDFWFEYRTAIPKRHFATLALLRELRESGIRLAYLNGNHDFWLGPFLHSELGIELHDGALTLERHGRRIWIHHGDGLIGGDLGYRVLKKVIRHPLSIGLYRLVHPDLGIPLAGLVSRLSRGNRDERPFDGERLWLEVAKPRFEEGFDVVMIGHFHHAWERREGGREFIVLGDWIRNFTYAVIDREGPRLERWSGLDGTVRIASR
jgi:UDP-2,3-diacylglucosamine hydrolase